MKRIDSLRLTISLLVIALFALSTPAQEMAGMHHAAAMTGPVVDIARDPAEVPPPVGNRAPTTVKVELTAEEVVGQLDPAAGTTYRYWTFNGKLPGPMIRVRQGDTVEVTLKNDPKSHMVHSVDFHAALGPGGGAAFSQATPGQAKTFTFVATTPGLFVYHCGTPMIGDHIANGMYGLILVEPAGGLAKVDREYYVMQGEIYTASPKGKAGMQAFSETKLLAEAPEYFVFNGAVDALTTRHPLHANTGETVRIFFGDAGPNATSSIHVVGEIFTHVYEQGSLTSAPLNGVQTASVAAGSAAMLELKTTTAGKFNFMDHAMARMAKGLMGTIEVGGVQDATLMHAGPADAPVMAQAMVAGRGDGDPASVPFTNDAGMKMDGMKMEMPQPTAKPHAASVPAGLDGCLNFVNGAPMLTLFRSDKEYHLQAKPMLLSQNPLLFAGNIHTLVHVNGKRAADGWFEVSGVDPLSPTCETTLSLSQLRQQAAARTAQANATAGGAVTIGMGDMSFSQTTIEVTVGQQVTWKNTSNTIHNVVDDAAKASNAADVKLPGGAPAFDSGFLQPGQSFAKTFTVPGVYKYVCTLHESGGMKGVIVVKPAAGAVDMAKK